MSTIKFVNTDVESILKGTIDKYEQKGQTLYPADPERLIIDCMAYRELMLREQMNGAMRQNFVQLASDTSLDMWGELFGCVRNKGEIDDDYRERIMALNKGSLGTKEAYRACLKGAPDILDAKLANHFDDSTIDPGTVKFSALQDSANGTVKPDTQHIDWMMGAIHDESFGVLGVNMVYVDPTPKIVSGEIYINLMVNANKETVKANVLKTVTAYISSLSESFTSVFSVNILSNLIKNLDGVYKVMDPKDLNPGELTDFQYYKQGEIIINV